MAYTEDFSSKKLISDFNEAGFQIQRLHFLYTLCNNFATKGEFREWNWRLDRIALELNTDMIDEDGKEESDKDNSFYQRLKIVNTEIALSFSKKDREAQYKNLMKKEALLRLLQYRSGKGGKKRHEDADFFD